MIYVLVIFDFGGTVPKTAGFSMAVLIPTFSVLGDTFTSRVPVIGKGSCTQSQMGFIQFDISESARRTGRFVTRPTLVVYDSCSLTGLRGVSYGNDFITSWVKLASLD